jgi:DNA-binding transcriptional regulator YhcF (GntR family)
MTFSTLACLHTGMFCLIFESAVKIQINRDLAVPIYTQIVGQTKFDIVSGRLPSGMQLPSIRELAQSLNVAPMTITQAYQELKQLGLIEMRPGLGTFVVNFDVADVPTAANRSLQLRRILQGAVTRAQADGFDQAEISQVFLSLLTESDNLFTNYCFVLVGLFSDALRIYADDLERQLAEERVVVEPVTFAELEHRPDAYLSTLEQAEGLLVPLHQVQTLRDSLVAAGIQWEGPIIGLSLELRADACQAITAIADDQRIGIVSLFPEFVTTMIQGISTVRPLTQPPVISLASDEAGLTEIVSEAQAIVFSSGANGAIEKIRSNVDSEIPVIEFLHTPNAASVKRIRQLLAVQTGNSSA